MNVVHEKEKNRFVIYGEKGEAEINYQVQDGEIDIHRTFVPDSLRGKGLAGILAEAALSYAKEQHLKVIANCSYIEKYLRRSKQD